MFTDIIDKISYFIWENGVKSLILATIAFIVLWVFIVKYDFKNINNQENLQNIETDIASDFDYIYGFESLNNFQREIIEAQWKFAEIWILAQFEIEEIAEANKEINIVSQTTGKKQKIIIKNTSGNTIQTNIQITVIDVDTWIEREIIIKEDNLIIIENKTLNEPEVYRELVIIDLETRKQEKFIIIYIKDPIVDNQDDNNNQEDPELGDWDSWDTWGDSVWESWDTWW
jgi:hypothetical protein